MPRLSPEDLVRLGFMAPPQYRRQDDGRYRRGTKQVLLRPIPRAEDICSTITKPEPEPPDAPEPETRT